MCTSLALSWAGPEIRLRAGWGSSVRTTSERRFNRPLQVPPDVHRRVLKRLRDGGAAAWRERLSVYTSEAERVLRDHRGEVLRLFGADRYERWRRHVESRPPERSSAVLRELGVDQRQLLALNAGLRRVLHEMASQTIFTPPVDQLPDVVRPATASVFRPPFPGMHTDAEIEAESYGGPHAALPIEARFSGEPTTSVDVATGRVEASLRTTNPRASDSDFVSAFSQAWVGFFYRTPRHSPLTIVVKARPTAVKHHVTLSDEWGWSSSTTHQGTAVEFKCTGPDSHFQGLAVTSEVFREETSGTFESQPLPTTTVELEFSTGGSFPAGTDVWVEVGAGSIELNFANDVSVETVTTGRWVIASVQVGPAA